MIFWENFQVGMAPLVIEKERINLTEPWKLFNNANFSFACRLNRALFYA